MWYLDEIKNKEPIRPIKSKSKESDKYGYLIEHAIKNVRQPKVGLFEVNRHDKLLNLNKVLKWNEIQKKDFIKMFGGKTHISKTLELGNEKEDITTIRTKIGRLRIPSLIKNFLMSLDVSELKALTINKQQIKLAKVIKELYETSYDAAALENIIQNISTLYSKTKGTVTYTFSIDPWDFIRQSFGTGWESCHQDRSLTGGKRFGNTNYSKAVWVAQSLDSVSSIITINNDNKDPKGRLTSRCAVYINFKEKKYSFGRSYPGNWNTSDTRLVLKDIRKFLKSKGLKEVAIGTANSNWSTDARELWGSGVKDHGGAFKWAKQGAFFGYNDFTITKKENKNVEKIYFVPDNIIREVLCI